MKHIQSQETGGVPVLAEEGGRFPHHPCSRSRGIRAIVVIIICCFLSSITAALIRSVSNLPLIESHRSWIFDRRNADFECFIPEEEEKGKQGKKSPSMLLTNEEMESFKRDGAVFLRNVISSDWLHSYEDLLMHVFNNPSNWDILYSRLVGNFYGAQKVIFLHQSSPCGRYVGSESPAAQIAAQLFAHLQRESNSTITNTGTIMKDDTAIRMRVIEPAEALMNFADSDGHTSWHRDDIYMPYHQEEMELDAKNNTTKRDIVVIRVWVPLEDMSLDELHFLALNNSKLSIMERKEKGFDIQGPKFSDHDKLSTSDVINKQIIGPGKEGYKAGDLLVFAGDTPHFAKALNCSKAGCKRLIFSYALDGKALMMKEKKPRFYHCIQVKSIFNLSEETSSR